MRYRISKNWKLYWPSLYESREKGQSEPIPIRIRGLGTNSSEVAGGNLRGRHAEKSRINAEHSTSQLLTLLG